MSSVAVLMSAYHGTDPQALRHTLDSVFTQTRRADEVIVVKDGPLSKAAEDVLKEFPDLKTVPLEHNQGLGPALNAGLKAVTSDYVARIDTDDVAFPERLEVQEKFLDAHPGIDVLGTAMREFESSISEEGRVRTLPETHAEIARYALINTPVNHPSVMVRTAALREAGGYHSVHFMEDYDLWARMLARGHRFHNLARPLTYFRVTDAQFARRTGREMFAAERQMQANLVDYGLIGPWRARLNVVVRSAYRLLPTGLLRRVYSVLFHR